MRSHESNWINGHEWFINMLCSLDIKYESPPNMKPFRRNHGGWSGKFYMTQGIPGDVSEIRAQGWWSVGPTKALESKRLSNLLFSVAPAEFEPVPVMPG